MIDLTAAAFAFILQPIGPLIPIFTILGYTLYNRHREEIRRNFMEAAADTD